MSNKHSSIGFLVFVAMLIAVPVLHGALPVPSPGAILYVSDMTANAIYAFTPAGVQSPFVSTGLDAPEGLAFDAAGNLYEADFNTGTVREYSSTGTLINANFITGLSLPVGLAFDAAGNLYVADLGTGTIKKFGPTGGAVPLLTIGAGLTPYALAFDAADILYEADSKGGPNGAINRFTTTGTALTPFVTGLDFPQGLAFDAAGNLYVSENGPQDVKKFSPAGTFITTFASGFSNPFGLAFDAAGNLYVADYGNGTITKFGPAGTPITPFASGLQNPTFLAFQPPKAGVSAGLPVALDGPFQINAFGNLAAGPQIINVWNDGANGTGASIFTGTSPLTTNGNICANVYVFDATDEQEIACCSCLLTPNEAAQVSAAQLISKTVELVAPTSIVVKLIATNAGTATSCSPVTAGSITSTALVNGMMATGTHLHAAPGGGFALTETMFIPAILSAWEFNRATGLCSFITGNQSGADQCPGCTPGVLGAVRK